MRALDVLIDAGVSRVLTSGGPGTALDGRGSALRRLVDHADGRISIMAGGKVRGENVAEIVRRSGVREVHARCERDRSAHSRHRRRARRRHGRRAHRLFPRLMSGSAWRGSISTARTALFPGTR